MSFSRYAIEKKQVSTDRGVTWEDATPYETRQGSLVGTFRTLIECEDAACDLEKTEYTIIDGTLPNEICGDMISILPSGIANMVSWTSGAICCNTWQSATPKTTDRNGLVMEHSIGSPRCVQDSPSYCPSFNYSYTHVAGREMSNFCFNVRGVYGWSCPETLCACFTIDSFMPWAEGKTSWKLIQSQHYVREHCSEAWVEDGEPTIVGIAERWKFVDETFESERWIHQIAKTFDDNGNVVTWESEGNVIYRQMTDVVLDPNIEILDYVINDGVLKYNGGIADSKGNTVLGIALDENRTNFGGNIYNMWCQIQSPDDYGASYNASTTDWDGYTIPPSIVSGDHWSTGWYHSTVGEITNMFKYFYLSGSPNTKNPSKFELFGLSGTKSAKFTNKAGETIAFPCRIHENLGQDDDYWNSSQIGYVRRDGDGSMIAMEYILGSYTDTSGDTKQIKNNLKSLPSLPNAVSVTLSDVVNTIPDMKFMNNTTLTSITMPNVATIGESAFVSCTALESVTFGNTSVTIGDNAFKRSGLKTVSLQNVTALGTAPGQINTGYVFSGCTQLETIEFGTSITYLPIGAFYRCTSLTSATIPSNVTTIGDYAFQKCSSLSSVTISDGVTTMPNAFLECTSLKSVEIPSSVTSYRAAFWNCSNLKYVTIHTSAEIKDYTFSGCNITELTITTTILPGIESYNTPTRMFTFAPEAVILVPPSAVDRYKNDGHWSHLGDMIHPIPNETEWVNIGYACVGGLRYDYEHKRGRNTEYSDEWFYLPEYRTVGEPYGECDGTEPY